MKLKLLVLLCVPLLFTGCDGEVIYRYVYRNATDKTIYVEAYDANYDPVKVRDSFSIPPGEERALSLVTYSRYGVYPFEGSNHVRVIKGNRMLLFSRHSEEPDYLFDLECYKEVPSKSGEIIFLYTFTEKDFLYAGPIDKE